MTDTPTPDPDPAPEPEVEASEPWARRYDREDGDGDEPVEATSIDEAFGDDRGPGE